MISAVACQAASPASEGSARGGRAVLGAFATLTPSERRILRRWAVAARASGIDTVEDLAARGWPAAFGAAVIGIFRHGRPCADALAVGQDGAWVVACCATGRVSSPTASLADALALVFPSDGLPGCAGELPG